MIGANDERARAGKPLIPAGYGAASRIHQQRSEARGLVLGDADASSRRFIVDLTHQSRR